MRYHVIGHISYDKRLTFSAACNVDESDAMVIKLSLMIKHLGKGLEPRASSGRVSQNPRVAMRYNEDSQCPYHHFMMYS